MKLTRRFLSLLLALCLSVSLVTPAIATEADPTDEPTAATEETTAATEAPQAEEGAEEDGTSKPEGGSTFLGTETSEEGSEEEDEETTPAGTEDDPIPVEITWNDENTVGSATVTVPAGATCWFSAYGSGLVLYINGTEYGILTSASPRTPAIFSITNDGEADAEYALRLTWPVGSQMNPDVMVLGDNEASVEADSQGYYFTYTAPADGELTITMGSCDHGWFYVVNNLTAGKYGDMHYSDDSEVVASETISVTAGDEIQVTVTTNEDWAIPAGTVTFTAEYALGNEPNPIPLEVTWNEDYSEATAAVTVPAETTQFFSVSADGLDLYIDGEYYCRLVSAGWRQPAVFSISNKAKGEQEFALTLKYPIGSQMNPDVMILGVNEAAVEADSTGYFYTFTAPEDGELTITMGDCEHGWFYQVSNITAGTYGDMHYSDDAEVVASETISVTAGDEIQVTVATNENWAVPAGTVTFTAEYGLGSDLNPIYPEFVWNEDYTEADATVTIPAETTHYFAVYASGMDLYIDGEFYCHLEAAGFRQPAIFTIPNKAKGEQEFALHLQYPVGSDMNPAEMVLGDNEAAVEEDSTGFFFTYIAPEDGEIVITMGESEHGWSYVVNNLTAGKYGDMHYSDDAEVVASETISVTAGDEIQVIVATNEDWAVPAGTVTFTAEYTLGHKLNPIAPDFVWAEDYSQADVTVTIPAETTHYFTVNADGMDLYVGGEYYCRLEAAGFRMPATFSITNKAKGEQEFTLHLEYPVGSDMNPAEMVLGDNEANVEEDSMGFFFTYTAPADGELTITMGDCEHGWSYSVSNITAGKYGDMHYSDDPEVVASETISVTAGDEIQVVVATNEDWSVPAGTVTFTAEYALGNEPNPIPLEFTWNDDYTEATATVTVPAETTQFFAVNADGLDLYVEGEYYCRLAAAGWRQPAVFSITNKAKGEQEFALTLKYPVGSQMNPETLVLGVNEAAVEADSMGYFYTFIAPEDGEIVITMGDCEHGWSYVVNNLTAGKYGDMHYSDDPEPVASETISVTAGDEIQVIVATNEDWAVPAGTVTFTAEYVPGHWLNPITPDFVWNEDNTEADATVTIPAETTHYFTVYADGMDLYVNGEYYCRLEAPGFRMPATFSITNKARGEQEFTLHLQYPAGSEMNPTELVLGANAADVEEDSMGYFYTWTAPCDGELTITMGDCEHGWSYSVSNITAGKYGDMHYSDDWEIVASETISVSKGDVIQVTVATNEDWSVPAGTVNFTAAFRFYKITGASAVVSGKTVALKAVLFGTGKAQKVTWSVDDSFAPYASISASGVLTGKQVAEPVTVTVVAKATLNGAAYTETFDVTVYPAITRVDIQSAGSYVTDGTLYLDTTEASELNLSAVAYPYADMAAISWKSSSTKVATVADGKVTAVSAGTVTITCTAKDAAGTKTATVKVVIGAFADSVTIGNVPESLRSGSSATLTAETATKAEGVAPTTAGVTWSLANSADSAYVTLNASTGKVTAKTVYEKHTVTVVATSKDGRASASCEIVVLPKAQELLVLKVGDEFVTKTTLSVPIGGSVDLDAYVMNELGEVTSVDAAWTKSASDLVMTVDDYGYATIRRPATVTVTAKYTTEDGSTLTTTVKVKAASPVKTGGVPVYYIDFWRNGAWLNDSSMALAAGKSTTVEYSTNANATDKTLTWSVEVVRYDENEGWYVVCPDETPLVTVSSKGKLTAAKNIYEPQTVRVTATAVSNPDVQSSFYVTAAPAAYAIRISRLEWVWNEETETEDVTAFEMTNTTTVWDMESTDWMTLRADVFSENQPVTWKSSNTKVADIWSYNDGTTEGHVAFYKPGTVTFTATATDGSGVKASFTLKVVKNVSSITLQDVNIAGGKSVTLKPVVGPTDATNKKLNWAVYMEAENGDFVPAPETVATVSSSGKLTTKATDEIRTVYVAAEAQDGGGCCDICEVTIYPATASVELSCDGATGTVTMGVDETISLEAVNKAASGEADAFQGWTWKSSNAKVATVDEDGNVTGLKAGTVTITATAADGSGKKATIKVVVK